MSSKIEELMTANLMEVFNERDPRRRRAAIDRTYSHDVSWTDDEEVSVGRDRLESRARALQEGQLAGLSFVAAGRCIRHKASDISHGMSSPRQRRADSVRVRRCIDL
jgi:hypothetical protein